MTVLAGCANGTDIFAQYALIAVGLYGIMPQEKGELSLSPNAFVISAAACAIGLVAYAVEASAVRFPTGAAFSGPDGNCRVAIAQKDGWTPVVFSGRIQPGSALDFFALRPTGFRVGEHGRIVVRGGQFEFAERPGVPLRFWGVNFNYGASVPPETEAGQIAARLARLGYNSVRLHHHDGGIVRKTDSGVELDEGKMRRMDALIAACAKQGIYVSTDLYVSRKASRAGLSVSGTDRDVKGMEYKELLLFHEGVASDYFGFVRAFLNRVNVFTGVRYADDPAIAFLSLVNENEFGNHGAKNFANHDCIRRAWFDWIEARRRTNPREYGLVPENANPSDLLRGPADSPLAKAFMHFVAEAERRFVAKAKAVICGELGCKALVTSLNGYQNWLAYQPVRAECFDYVDTHFYTDHPKYRPKGGKYPLKTQENCENPVKNGRLASTGLAPMRILGKPFVLTEFNYCAPGRFRALGNLAFGSMASLQDWSGLWRFTYGHSSDHVSDPVPGARIGSFNGANDPMSIAADKAIFALFVRGDLRPLKNAAAVHLAPSGDSPLPFVSCKKLPWDWLSWYFRTGTHVGKRLPDGIVPVGGASAFWSSSEELRRGFFPEWNSGGDVPNAGNGSVEIEPERGAFSVSTPSCAGGFAERGDVRAGAVRAKLTGGPAGVWALSLDGKPLAQANRILVAHATDAQNTGAVFSDETRSTVLDWGRSPMLMRSGRAEVAVACEGLTASVYALADDGRRLREVSSCLKDGLLSFTADVASDPESATWFYEITVNVEEQKRKEESK